MTSASTSCLTGNLGFSAAVFSAWPAEAKQSVVCPEFGPRVSELSAPVMTVRQSVPGLIGLIKPEELQVPLPLEASRKLIRK